jgi:Arylsulfotransferase (ASST)
VERSGCSRRRTGAVALAPRTRTLAPAARALAPAMAARALALPAVAAVALAFAAAYARAVTLSPLDGTPDASPHTQISFLGVPLSQISHVSVVGSRSGSHAGKLRAYASAAGASFLPTRGFSEGELVRVSALIGTRRHERRIGTTFSIARQLDYSLPAGRPLPPAKPGTNQSFVSEPKLQPPSVEVTASSPSAALGDIFLTSDGGRGQNGALILSGAGRLVWFLPAAPGDAVDDLQLQSYEGRPALTFWEGHIDVGVGFGSDQILSSNYVPIASVNAGNGYHADLHDLQLTPQGSAYVTTYSLVRADLSGVGGSRDGELQDAVVQLIDVRTGLVMFEWHAYGHVALVDSYAHAPRDSDRPWDFFHLNSISPDPWGDGNFLISSRNTWALYEISQHDGAILWRVGGKASSFRMGPGTGTAWQHDARWLPDRTLTIFDNGATPKAHSQSRAIHERIDFKRGVVQLIGRDVHAPPLLAGSQGDAQVLANGDTFVGWGEKPYFSEFDPSGRTVFDAHLPAPVQVYRAFRYQWSAVPAAPPAVALKATDPAHTTVYASWNGATGVSAWRVLGGATPSTLATLATAPVSGFETAIPVASAAPVFAAQALGPAGEVLATSRAIAR